MNEGPVANVEKQRVDTSPQVLARIAGALYLFIIVVGIFGEAFVRERLIVSGDAAATAANIRSMDSLWRFGIGSELLLLNCAVASTWILFVLLRPVSRDIALLATLFNLVAIAVEAAIQLLLLAALFPLGTASYLSAFAPPQLFAITSLALKLHGYGFGISLLFFGWVCIIWGYLIFRSGYFPKAIGVLMQIAGVCYLLNSYTLILAPSLANQMFPAILVPSFIGEASLCLWLLVKGVNLVEWNRRQAPPRP